MRRVDGLAHIEVDVGGFLEQQLGRSGTRRRAGCSNARNACFRLIISGVFQHLVDVMTPSVTRSTPSILAIGGTSLASKARLTCSGLPKNFAAMDEVDPPQTMCLPSLEKKSAIMRLSSSRLEGGPKSKFIGSLLRMRTTQAVASSPGLPPYSLLHYPPAWWTMFWRCPMCESDS